MNDLPQTLKANVKNEQQPGIASIDIGNLKHF